MTPFPCIFQNVKEQNQTLKTAFYYGWFWLEYFGNKHTHGKYIDKEVFCMTPSFISPYRCDLNLTKNLLDDILNDNFDTDLSVIYYEALDETGHFFGWCSTEYEDYLGQINEYIGDILAALEKKSIFLLFLFILSRITQ